ncbi:MULTISPECIES: DUF922 domain-containing protein [unclassified Motilimonas]|uniref:DUF922 domain-containing protein n=1 Tax=Motilimonas TaxID=1914248 RepID=UPI001E5F47D7|nr:MULTISPECIES: DUF922 domain-containing protein [unclassified Motilimonas]MCE0558231.1 DUF922 domain-containing Zn-dependent protease [Motilimonas sp. E26]MDO6526411.1 DUF922 domain-containing protein [Motilimonas sp. 1_MG-2023]
MIRLFFCLSSLLSVLISFPLWATPEITIHYKHLGFYGQTEHAISEQLSKQNDYFAQHKVFHNDNHWQKGWVLITKESPSGCKITHVNTWLKIDYRLPRWLDQATAPEALQLKWEGFYQGIFMHLDGHKKIAVEALQAIEKSILTLPAAATCEEIKLQAEDLAQQHILKIANAEKNYDQDTQFGLSQGTSWLSTQ